MQLSLEQVEEIRNWPSDKFPPRSLIWIQWITNKEDNVWYTLTTTDSGAFIPKRGFLQLLKVKKKEYWQFLDDNKIPPTEYDKSIGNYHDWLEDKALEKRRRKW